MSSRNANRFTQFIPAVLVVVLLSVGIPVAYRWAVHNPRVALLEGERGAEWIRADESPYLKSRAIDPVVRAFRVQLSVESAPSSAPLLIKAMKRATVSVDGSFLYTSSGDDAAWKEVQRLELAPRLSQGTHKLTVTVSNQGGPACLLAYAPTLGIATGPDWETSIDGETWTPALGVNDSNPSELSQKFPRANRAFIRISPVLILMFLLASFGSRLARRNSMVSRYVNAANVRWFVLMAWLALAVNNYFKMPLYVGFDIPGHVEYVRTIVDDWRIPLANEGWQAFQSPLYYLLCAPIFSLVRAFGSPEAAERSLRILTLLAGAGLIDVCFRTMRGMYPNRPDLQVVGTLLGGLMPMNLYMCQYAGNEPLAAFFMAAAIACAIAYAHDGKMRPLLFTGLFLGLALLSKATAILLVPPLLILFGLFANGPNIAARIKRTAVSGAAVLGIAFAIAGWYYIRNWIVLGSPFIGGWDAARGIAWWQDPGYRTLAHFTSFGESFKYPVHASFAGIWDGLYSTMWMDGFVSSMLDFEFRPPWNYSFALAGVWLATLPTAAIGAGVVRCLTGGADRRIPIFAGLCIAIFIAALLHLYLTVPAYSVAKATYMLGLGPCFAILACHGLERIAERPWFKPIVQGWFAAWAVVSYSSYFVL